MKLKDLLSHMGGGGGGGGGWGLQTRGFSTHLHYYAPTGQW